LTAVGSKKMAPWERVARRIWEARMLIIIVFALAYLLPLDGWLF